MHQCYVDGEFKPPCNAFACWAFSTPQISMLTDCDRFPEFRGDARISYTFKGSSLPPKKHIYQLLFLRQSASEELMTAALLL